MVAKTTRELTADTSPAPTRVIPTWEPTGVAEPLKSTIAQLMVEAGAAIKTAYEGEADTNAFLDDEKTKLTGIEESATADQTAQQIATAIDADATAEATLTAALVTTTAVTTAGALMDSEVDADLKTFALPANTTISAFGATVVDDADAAAVRTTLELGTVATADVATTAEVRSATAAKALTANHIEDASAIVTLTDAATIAVDWDTFINAQVTLADNRTLGLPTNGQLGTWRRIAVIQDGTGSRTLALAAGYVTVGGAALTLTTEAGSIDVLSIYCRTAEVFEVFSALDMKAPA